jgi:hypothetical protein
MPNHKDTPEKQELKKDAHTLLVGGATLGAFSAITGALLGATCPMCIVVAPVMLGAGAFKRWQLAQLEKRERDVDATALAEP